MGRRQRIGDRITAIRARIGELQQPQHTGKPVSSGGQLADAQHHAAISEAAAQRALAASIDAFRRAAEAHERLVTQYEQAAAARGSGQETTASGQQFTPQPPPRTGSEPTPPNPFSPAAPTLTGKARAASGRRLS